jgi:hypothetical protein
MIGKQGDASGVKRGGTYRVELDLCNALSSDNEADLTFASGQEHDLSAGRQGDVDWTWSRQHTFPQGAHSRQLERGTCLSWMTVWNTRDDAGRLVEPGRYDIVASVRFNGRTESLRFTIEVTA